jgi:probable H4MPT-linked C1 transfer pathway protein
MNANQQPFGWLAPPESPPWIGLDVGGANLKVADGRGRAASMPFALWRDPQGLAAAIAALLKDFDASAESSVALTMTGELADCYASKADGVRAILDAALEATRERLVLVATVDDRWLSPDAARRRPSLVAAANWRLGARLVSRQFPIGRGVWIDCGSTTTDVIPVKDGKVVASGANDTQRLLAGELVYAGVRRTPVCALVDLLPYRGHECPVAAEWFATTADVWMLLGHLPEDIADIGTADGRPLVRRAAVERLARCLCADGDSFNESDATAAAERVAENQRAAITAAIDRHDAARAVFSGEGEFLAGLVRGGEKALLMSDLISSAASRAFPAHAAAVLASLEMGDDL